MRPAILSSPQWMTDIEIPYLEEWVRELDKVFDFSRDEGSPEVSLPFMKLHTQANFMEGHAEGYKDVIDSDEAGYPDYHGHEGPKTSKTIGRYP